MEDNVISTRSLVKEYGRTRVVDNVNINVKRGDIYAIVGKNGAGKTTIMKMLLGLAPETGGEISLFGESGRKNLSRNRRRIGAMIETPAFYPYMSAYDNLNYYRIQFGIKNTDCINQVLSTVGLENTKGKKFRNFSLGMKQRLGLALALLAEPELLILDEPINGLDPEGIIEVREILKRLNKEKNMTIFISSHILSELSLLAEKFAFIDHGRIISEADINEIQNSAGNETVLITGDNAAAAELIRLHFPEAEFETRENDIVIRSGYDEDILPLLTKNSISIKSVSTVTVSLEDYYIDLLRGYNNDKYNKS